MFSEPIDIPIEKIESLSAKEKGIELYIKRDDLIHPEISGNKWRKLKYNLLKAQSQNNALLITLGGAYSNHIAATAALGKEFGIKTKGIIRGDEFKTLNPTLKKAKENGMVLEFISREHYAERNEEWFKQEVLERHEQALFIPEGGANFLGMQGCSEIIQEIDLDFNYICTSAGTGTTASGLSMALKEEQKLLVFPALKGGEFLREEIEQQLYWAFLNEEAAKEQSEKTVLFNDYHFGGYGKVKPELIHFMRSFFAKTKIKLDPIYTGKMVYGVFDLIEKGHFNKGDKIVLLHTGGLRDIDLHALPVPTESHLACRLTSRYRLAE